MIAKLALPVLSVSDARVPVKRLSLHFSPISRCSPWLTPLVYALGRYLVLPAYFGRITVLGRHHIPPQGPVILAPTHRSRWDPILLSLAAGRWATGRDLHFMVTANEVRGIQGWFIRRLGGFSINTERPSVASLRHGVDLIQQGAMFVIFPEGNIFRDGAIAPLKPGLARLALQAEAATPGTGVKVVPVSLHYSDPHVGWRTQVTIKIGPPLAVERYLPENTASDRLKASARDLTGDLTTALDQLTHPPCPYTQAAMSSNQWHNTSAAPR